MSSRIRGITFAFMVALLLPIPVTAQTVSRQIPVTEEFTDGELFIHGLPGQYLYRIHVIDVGGQLEICGAGVFTDSYTRSAFRGLLRGATILMDGQGILENLTYFARVNSQNQLVGALANCRATGMATPTSGQPDFGIDFPSGPVQVN